MSFALGRAAATEDGKKRVDDNAETAKKRFSTFNSKTVPLVEKLDEEKLVFEIDATKDVKTVFKDTKKNLDEILELRKVFDE